MTEKTVHLRLPSHARDGFAVRLACGEESESWSTDPDEVTHPACKRAAAFKERQKWKGDRAARREAVTKLAEAKAVAVAARKSEPIPELKAKPKAKPRAKPRVKKAKAEPQKTLSEAIAYAHGQSAPEPVKKKVAKKTATKKKTTKKKTAAKTTAKKASAKKKTTKKPAKK